MHRHPEHRRQRIVDNACHGALPRLYRPAGELRSVVGDIEPKTNKPATGIDGGFVLDARFAFGFSLVAHAARTCRHPRRSLLSRPWPLQQEPRLRPRLLGLSLGFSGLSLVDRRVLCLDLVDGLLGRRSSAEASSAAVWASSMAASSALTSSGLLGGRSDRGLRLNRGLSAAAASQARPSSRRRPDGPGWPPRSPSSPEPAR